MRKMLILGLSCILPATWAVSAPPVSPPLPPVPPYPQISPAEGAAAVGLARQAMLDYLRDRVTIDAVKIPAPAEALVKKTGAAAVTLRSGGEQVAEAIRQEADLSRSIVAAALAAMRSPKLPDQVTAEYLWGLVVEVEVLSAPQKVEEADLPAVVVPGLVGVTASRGLDEFTMLPSASYARSLPADEVRRESLARLPLNAGNESLPVRWAVFSSSHHVGYPDGKVLWLRQGRQPMPVEMIDGNALSAAAEGVGLFLLRNRDPNTGQLKLPEGRADVVDQLYATFALARLGKANGRAEYTSAANAALGWAAGRLRQEPAYAYVAGVEDDRQLSAVSLFVLAIQELPASPMSEPTCRKLLATVDKALAGEAGLGTAERAGAGPGTAERSGAGASRPAEGAKAARSRLPLGGLALAYLAASRAEPNDVRRLDALRGSIASAPPADAAAACWLIRAGLAQARSSASAPAPASGGGFALAGDSPDTTVTALSAVNLAAGWTWPALSLPAPAAEADKARKAMILSARRLCWQAQYRPLEAYFAAKPELWVGGVRASPQGARITLEACAAAIEAFLAE